MNQRCSGFSLVEIAVVLVIIGLLLGGILKGQEMINSAKVRNLADMNSGVSAAYFGFQDRFHRMPGDWDRAEAQDALGTLVTGGGNNNGRIDVTGPGITSEWQEPNALWEHLAKAGFLPGAYTGDDNVPRNDSGHTPLNAYNQVVVLGHTGDFLDAASGDEPAGRLNLVLGRGIPVDIARELDLKMDDGVPDTGALRLTVPVGTGAVFGEHGEGASECVAGDAGPRIYGIAGDSQDCNLAYLY